MEHFSLWDHCRKLKLYNYLETFSFTRNQQLFSICFSLCLLKNSEFWLRFSEIVYRINFLSFLRILWDEARGKRWCLLFHVHTITSKHLMERWWERKKSCFWLHFTSSPWNCWDAVWCLDYDCELLWHSTGWLSDCPIC